MEPKAATKDDRQLQDSGNPKIIYLTSEAKPREVAKCPSCGEEVAIDAKVCDHCKKVLAVSTETVDKASSDQADAVDSLNYVKNVLAAKYNVLEEVARTESSIVFRATEVQSGREVALKVLLQNLAQDHDYTDRFHRRVRTIARLSHSNIISIYDEGIEGDVHYMAMEYLKGTDLQKKIAEHGPLSPDEVVNVMIPVINALGHSHRNGIVHGNIKCSGIFLHDDGRTILFGFGTQQSTKGNRPSFSREMESVEYLSPEEASGKGMDGRSDIYSLGVIMYYSLTGKLPYAEANPFATINTIINGRYTPISRLRQVPQWLESIVDRCLQKDISKRVQSCGEILGYLNAKSSVQSANNKLVEQPAVEEIAAPVSPKKKPVETKPTEMKAPAPPIIEEPTEKEIFIEHQKAEPPVVEKPLKEAATVAPPIAKQEVIKEQPIKSRAKVSSTLSTPEEPIAKPQPMNREVAEKQVSSGKGKTFVWVIAVGIVAILGVGITLMMMHKSESVSESAATTASAKYGEQVQNQSSRQPIVNNEQSTSETQVASKNVRNEEPAVQKPQQAISTENNKPASSHVSSKSKASVVKENTEAEAPPVIPLVSVPDLIGTQLSVAKSILSLNGLKVGAVSTIPDPPNDGMVVRQVPKPGTHLQKGSTINLIVGSK
ncbi:MAG: protein kinase domain-containing protein [Candidatus Kryptoniota bacterium]